MFSIWDCSLDIFQRSTANLALLRVWPANQDPFRRWFSSLNFQGLVIPLLFPSPLCCLHSLLISGASRNVGWKSQEKHNQSKLKAARHIDERFGKKGIMILYEFLKCFPILLIYNIFESYIWKKIDLSMFHSKYDCAPVNPSFYNQEANTHFSLVFLDYHHWFTLLQRRFSLPASFLLIFQLSPGSPSLTNC